MSLFRLLLVLVATLITGALSYACAEGDVLEQPALDTSGDGGGDGGIRSPGTDSSSPAPPTEPVTDGAAPDAPAPSDGGPDGSTDAGTDAGLPPFDGGVVPTLGDGGTFMVVRIGATDAGTLTAAATAVFVEERRVDDGALTRTISLPVAASGVQRPFTLRGTATTEGALSLSADGRFVTLAGYAAAPGTADVATTPSATTPRVVARIDAAGVVDTSTGLDTAFSTASVRAATTHDGSVFWVSGEDGNASSGGVYAAPFGVVGAGTQVFSTVQNLRTVGIFGSQLHASTQSGTAGNTLRIFTVGSGLPVAAGQVGSALPGVTSAETAPHGFVLLDLDANEPGIDTMYVADTRALASGGGVQRWKKSGTAWAKTATFTSGLGAGALDVAAARSGSDVTVLCVTLDTQPKLIRFVDDGTTAAPAGVTLAVSPGATLYRGVAVAPR